MEDFVKQWEENQRKLDEKDAKAKAEGKLVGRFIQEPFADGYAIYEITKENKKTVRIRVVDGIGDDWRIPYWGDEATIEKSYALKSLAWRDKMNKLFSKQ